MDSLEHYFDKFRNNIIGCQFDHDFMTGRKRIVYADWAASGRLYRPIEDYISHKLGPYVANTHTETNLTGTVMTNAYHQAHTIIKQHVNAGPEDQLLFAGYGMTAVINKFQRILALRVPELYRGCLNKGDRPLIIITHMEHHSNQTSWLECMVDVEIIRRADTGLPDLEHLQEILKANANRRLVIGSFTACSNVTGIVTPIQQMAEIMHQSGGLCFVDYSALAPYAKIDMHPGKEQQSLDVIFFSPHKFLGGPGSSGVVLFNKKLYHNKIPDHPGGGTVAWTNPWGGHRYYHDIEVREDGGTPGFLQAIKAALAILLKEEMGIEPMLEREHQLKEQLIEGLDQIPGVIILEVEQRHRIGYVSFYVDGIHHNLIVRLLNDRYGIQVRGGCVCAGTYGHLLLHIDYEESKRITNMIDLGDLSKKPGWVRVSLHPVMTNAEVDYIVDAIGAIVRHHKDWADDYRFNVHTGDFETLHQPGFTIDIKKTFRA